jgi:hypothetical protein
MDQPAAPSPGLPDRLPTQHGNGPVTAATTVRLATAAHVLGISPASAQELAEREEFPCNVIWTSDGYRVPFAALLRVLRSGRSHYPTTGQDGKPGKER